MSAKEKREEVMIGEGDEVGVGEQRRESLSNEEIGRYSRQMILPCMGMPGQLALANAKVLVVGAGGLGCPVGMYLAGAGVGTLGFVDDDVVDVSNLHRQVLHREDRVGMYKVDSIIASLKGLNSHVNYVAHKCRLHPNSALDVLNGYDIVVDATDNAPTRYLINDACVLLGLPLISGSALRTDGQLTVYNYKGSPCYRCLFPDPPPAATVTNCSEGGVIGAVPGFIGTLQAMEVIKILMAEANGDGAGSSQLGVMAGRMLIVDGYGGHFRTIKLRKRRPDCVACGSGDHKMRALLQDYEAFCHMDACDVATGVRVRDGHQRVTATALRDLLRSSSPTRVLDVRPEVEFGICSLPNTTNIPLSILQRVARRGFSQSPTKAETALTELLKKLAEANAITTAEPVRAQASTEKMQAKAERASSSTATATATASTTSGCESTRVVTLCRRGNDSQHAAVLLEQLIIKQQQGQMSLQSGSQAPPSSSKQQSRQQQEETTIIRDVLVLDVVGGLHAWARHVDPNFPTY